MTPDDVREVRFRRPPPGRRGYDASEVDAFLDTAAAALDAGTPIGELARTARFRAGRGGYAVAEVDAFLDRLAAADAGAAPRRDPAPVPPSTVVAQEATPGLPSPFVTERSWRDRLRGRR